MLYYVQPAYTLVPSNFDSPPQAFAAAPAVGPSCGEFYGYTKSPWSFSDQRESWLADALQSAKKSPQLVRDVKSVFPSIDMAQVEAGAKKAVLSSATHLQTKVEGMESYASTSPSSLEKLRLAIINKRRDYKWMGVYKKLVNPRFLIKLQKVLREENLTMEGIADLSLEDIRKLWRVTHRRWHSSKRCQQLKGAKDL